MKNFLDVKGGIGVNSKNRASLSPSRVGAVVVLSSFHADRENSEEEDRTSTGDCRNQSPTWVGAVRATVPSQVSSREELWFWQETEAPSSRRTTHMANAPTVCCVILASH